MTHNGPAQLPNSDRPANRFGRVATHTGPVDPLSPWHHAAILREEAALREYRENVRRVEAAIGVTAVMGQTIPELRQEFADVLAEADVELEAHGPTPAFHRLATRFHVLADQLASRTGVDPRSRLGD